MSKYKVTEGKYC